jgi:hypothetical protein
MFPRLWLALLVCCYTLVVSLMEPGARPFILKKSVARGVAQGVEMVVVVSL